MDDDRPEWVRTSVTIWQEDDARTPDRERRHEAWRRLFGCEIPDRKDAIEMWDGGDTFLYLHENGRIDGYSFEGELIELTLEAAERYRNVLRNEIQSQTRRLERLDKDIAKVKQRAEEDRS
ncbi:MAG TPA: hypothetical protein VNI01_13085 [Elusimicrobiota bacterium]|nr:hypothetical protein [Elusimicrobiota bacterium]